MYRWKLLTRYSFIVLTEASLFPRKDCNSLEWNAEIISLQKVTTPGVVIVPHNARDKAPQRTMSFLCSHSSHWKWKTRHLTLLMWILLRARQIDLLPHYLKLLTPPRCLWEDLTFKPSTEKAYLHPYLSLLYFKHGKSISGYFFKSPFRCCQKIASMHFKFWVNLTLGILRSYKDPKITK